MSNYCYGMCVDSEVFLTDRLSKHLTSHSRHGRSLWKWVFSVSHWY